ncbi:MAG: hypothetical protein R3272_09150 [Candidatus Promineifilaceae bacterium]|nr:hypothetical protein [Candidatus Promineifilaceae bacterium]
MLSLSGLWPNVALLVAAALLIGYVGPKLSRTADKMGKITGMGDTVAGAIFLGAATSLPGIVASLRSAANGQPTLAVGTAIGSIAAQTMFIGLADVALRRGTITAEQTVSDSLMQTAVLVSQLSLVLVAMLASSYAIWGVHPVSPVIIVGGVLGFRAIQGEQRTPHWRATNENHDLPPEGPKDEEDEEAEGDQEATGHVVGRFGLYVVLVFIGGWFINTSANGIMEATGWSPVIVGSTLMGITTSFPELVTAISAVRQDRVGLAIGDIVGGNAFDTMVVATSDFFFREGSVYNALDANIHLLNALAILMTGLLLGGFIRRERRGPGNIGVESYLILLTYLAGIAVIIFFGGRQ